MHRRAISKNGHSLAVTIPKEYLQALGLDRGDLVDLELAANGRIMIRSAFPASHPPDPTSRARNKRRRLLIP